MDPKGLDPLLFPMRVGRTVFSPLNQERKEDNPAFFVLRRLQLIFLSFLLTVFRVFLVRRRLQRNFLFIGLFSRRSAPAIEH